MSQHKGGDGGGLCCVINDNGRWVFHVTSFKVAVVQSSMFQCHYHVPIAQYCCHSRTLSAVSQRQYIYTLKKSSNFIIFKLYVQIFCSYFFKISASHVPTGKCTNRAASPTISSWATQSSRMAFYTSFHVTKCSYIYIGLSNHLTYLISLYINFVAFLQILSGSQSCPRVTWTSQCFATGVNLVTCESNTTRQL